MNTIEYDDGLGELLTVRQVSQILSVSERSVREFISTGELRASKVGQWRIPRESLLAFFERRSNYFAEKSHEEVEAFLRFEHAERGLPDTMIVRDYPNTVPVDLGPVQNHINSMKPVGPGFLWRYVVNDERGIARHLFFGDPEDIMPIVNILDSIYDQ